MDISSLINKLKGAKKSKEEKQKEIIDEKIRDIEKIYEKVKKEKGKEKINKPDFIKSAQKDQSEAYNQKINSAVFMIHF